MNLQSKDMPIQELLPHRWPAVMIDALLEASPEGGAAAKTFRRQDYGLDGELVCETALVECVAQTTAALFGYQRLANPGGSGLGFLAALSSFSFTRPARIDEPLRIEVQVVRTLGPMCIVSGRVLAGDELIAGGEIKIYLQSENV
jgi:3-hydroxymyristoyl/3-hydroxydecanoyl-(acyl carrier protein) dehydratase